MALFDDFLQRNLATISATYTTLLHQQGGQVSQVHITTPQLMGFFSRLILTQTDMNDPMMPKVMEQARMLSISEAGVRQRLEVFVAALRQACQTDALLGTAQQRHIERMIDQSERYLLYALLPTLDWAKRTQETRDG